MLNVFLWAFAVYYGAVLLEVVLPFLAVLVAGRRKPDPDHSGRAAQPVFYIVAPCRDASQSIPGLVDCLRRQTYPADRFRILVIADNCKDDSAAVARSLGVEVYERVNSAVKTKSDAINECLAHRLKLEAFDALVIFDIDARVATDFLERAAAHWRSSPVIIQGFHRSRNPGENALVRIEDAVAAMLRLRQMGRALLGWPAYLVGSHGILMSRAALDRLEWILCQGHHITDDTELNLRAFVRGIPLVYAMDLEVANELPSAAQSIRTQRRRWGAGRLELWRPYLGLLLQRGLRGDLYAWQFIFGLLLSPPLSLFWIASGALSLYFHFLPIVVLFAVHGFYYATALFLCRDAWRWRDAGALILYLGIRVRALAESVGLAFAKGDRWIPTPHGSDPKKPV